MKTAYAFIPASVITVLCFTIAANNARAQFVHEGAQFPGVAVSVNFNEGEDLPIGVNYEYFVKRDFAIGGLFRYWTYTAYQDPNGPDKYVYNNYLIAAQGNYHFKVPQREFDPFMGVVLGYRDNTSGWQNETLVQNFSPSQPASLIFAIQAGARYFIADKIGLEGRLMFGSGNFTVFEVGADFAL